MATRIWASPGNAADIESVLEMWWQGKGVGTWRGGICVFAPDVFFW